ncbi:MAG TPA: hypothetical protein VEC59_10350 [Steroidobacteraceae bacterium]|nr:hypothetical protein [Steroidobacteraceae bacterium]
MNAAIHAFRRPGRRCAELDPFAVEPNADPGAGYGCVEWFAYGDEQTDASASRAEPKTGLPLVPPPEPPARVQRH